MLEKDLSHLLPVFLKANEAMGRMDEFSLLFPELKELLDHSKNGILPSSG